MADKVVDKVDAPVKADEVKEKEVSDSPPETDNGTEEEKEKENGDVCESKNGKSEDTDGVDSKDVEACPIKRKSTGGDASEGTPAEGVSPEKKAKLNEAAADAESNGEAEVAA